MTADLQAETLEWMRENSIKEIFEVLTQPYVNMPIFVNLFAITMFLQIITANVLFHKPDDPKTFIIDLLTTMKTQGAKPLLNQSDVQTMFGMFDVTQQGILTKQQAFNAVRAALGAKHPIVSQLAGDDAGDTQTLLNKDGFTVYVQGALTRASPKTES